MAKNAKPPMKKMAGKGKVKQVRTSKEYARPQTKSGTHPAYAIGMGGSGKSKKLEEM